MEELPPGIGFVGLGDQGGPMAVAVAEAGFPLHAWARRSQSYAALSSVEFERHPDLPSVASAADILLLCLRDDHDIADLIQDGLLLALHRGATVVNVPPATDAIWGLRHASVRHGHCCTSRTRSCTIPVGVTANV